MQKFIKCVVKPLTLAMGSVNFNLIRQKSSTSKVGDEGGLANTRTMQ